MNSGSPTLLVVVTGDDLLYGNVEGPASRAGLFVRRGQDWPPPESIPSASAVVLDARSYPGPACLPRPSDPPLVVIVSAGADADAWRAVPGVVAVLTEDDLETLPWSVAALLGAQRGASRPAEGSMHMAVVIEHAAESIVVTDKDSNIVYVNPAFERISGYSALEAIGQNPRMLKSGRHDDAFYRELYDTLGRGEAWKGGFINRRKDGSLYEEEGTISPIRDKTSGDVVGYVAVKCDVTEERRLSSQLQHVQKMDALGQLAGGIAHDFNNVLTAILGNISLAARAPSMDRVAHLLRDAEKASLRAAELVKQLLTFSRKSEVVMKPLHLAGLIREVGGIVRNTFDRRIEIVSLVSANLWSVKADSGQLHQVLLNLCVNARDALEAEDWNVREGGPRIVIEAENVTISPQTREVRGNPQPGRYAAITVSDNGVGMDEEVRRRVFDPFFTTKDDGKGTGLGLAMVYGIIKQHGGWIHLYSEPGWGTTFKIYLPAVLQASPLEAEAAEEVPAAGGTETVLLVDDEEIVRALCQSVLERQGYRVIIARDGREALQAYSQREREIDLVILDLSMPHLSGIETLERLRAFNPNVRVILASGYSLDTQHELFQSAQVLGFVPKPFQPADLLRMVRHALDAPLVR